MLYHMDNTEYSKHYASHLVAILLVLDLQIKELRRFVAFLPVMEAKVFEKSFIRRRGAQDKRP